MGWIHFRVNSSQLHNALRRRIDPDGTLDLSSKGAISRLRELLAEATPLRVNFAALAIETSTAMRQFLVMAKILHHIDADAPIRMLIAECEQPQTVLAALYFAKLFGIDDKVDVSPLFETESALEHGGRFLEALLAEESYRAYCPRARPGFGADRLFGCRALHRSGAGGAGDRAFAGPVGRRHAQQRADRRGRADLRYARGIDGPRRAPLRASRIA